MLYRYQDTHDSRIHHWIAQHEHGLSLRNASNNINYADAELHLWLRMHAWVTNLNSRRQMLDVGCGLGRIVDRFGWLFQDTICLEADTNRAFQAAQGVEMRTRSWELARKAGHLPKMRAEGVTQHVLNLKFLDFRPWAHKASTLRRGQRGSFDFISIIHVIQHIPTYEVQTWLQQAHRMLRHDGLLMLATTLANRSSLNLEGRSGEVTTSSFNTIASGSIAAKVIPVRYYTAAELRSLVLAAGLKILEQSPFVYHLCTHVPESQFVIATLANSTQGLSLQIPDHPPIDALYLSQPMRPSIRRQGALRMKLRKRCV